MSADTSASALVAARALRICRCHEFTATPTTSCERCANVARVLEDAYNGGWRDAYRALAEEMRSATFEATLHLATESSWERTTAALGRPMTAEEKAIGRGAISATLEMVVLAAEKAARE